MFYQILLFMPLKIVFGAFFSFLFLSFTAFFSFSSSHEVEEGSLVSGHVCLRTPPEGGRAGRLRHKQIHQKKEKRAGPEPSAPPQQSDKWWEDVETRRLGGRSAGLGMELADGSRRPSRLNSPRARPPPRPPSFVFVTACFLLCTATGRLFVKVRSRDVFPEKVGAAERARRSRDVGCL